LQFQGGTREKVKMEESQTWRDLLAEIIKDPQEKQRIADTLDINVITLGRWVRGDSIPRVHNLRRLLEVLPQQRAILLPLIAKEFDGFSTTSIAAPVNSIPVTFYAHILDLFSTTSDEQRFWSICSTVLPEALKQLDPDRLGLQISIIQCMAPRYGNTIRCLREYMVQGTPPWGGKMELQARFFGAESLAGYVVSTGHAQIIANLNEELRLPSHLPEHAVSAVAVPILYAGRVAGCLLVASTQPYYFSSPSLLELIQNYAALLMLAFHPEDFYERERIALQIMPSFQVQKSYLSTFQQRITALLKRATADKHSMSYNEAEQHAWWQIEEELSQHQLPG